MLKRHIIGIINKAGIFTEEEDKIKGTVLAICMLARYLMCSFAVCAGRTAPSIGKIIVLTVGFL
jgi:hypothetical protein